MGFWGWRQTAWMAFISVIVVACTDTGPIPRVGVSPTPRPITLTLQGSPGAPPATARPTLAAVTATPAEPDPAPVEILVPTCTETASDGYQCIGLVHNTTDRDHGTLLLRATLYDDGIVIESHTVAIEQRLIDADGRAPFRLIFDQSAVGPLVLDVDMTYPPAERLVRLATRSGAGAIDEADYVLRAVVVNEYAYPVEDVRAVATLYRDDELVGYRVVNVGTLDAGAEAPVDVRWYGMRAADGYSNTVTAAGLKSPSQ